MYHRASGNPVRDRHADNRWHTASTSLSRQGAVASDTISSDSSTKATPRIMRPSCFICRSLARRNSVPPRMIEWRGEEGQVKGEYARDQRRAK